MCNRDDELSHTRIVSQISAFQEMETPMTEQVKHPRAQSSEYNYAAYGYKYHRSERILFTDLLKYGNLCGFNLVRSYYIKVPKKLPQKKNQTESEFGMPRKH